MENSIRDPEFRSHRRRVHSTVHLGTFERPRTEILRRATSEEVPSSYARGDTSSSFDYLELLYRITDVVLVICAGVVIGSCIATLVLFGYGYVQRGATNNLKDYIILN